MKDAENVSMYTFLENKFHGEIQHVFKKVIKLRIHI